MGNTQQLNQRVKRKGLANHFDRNTDCISIERPNMDDETEPKTVNQQPPRRNISRRTVVAGLVGLATAEVVAGGGTWAKVFSAAFYYFLSFFSFLFSSSLIINTT